MKANSLDPRTCFHASVIISWRAALVGRSSVPEPRAAGSRDLLGWRIKLYPLCVPMHQISRRIDHLVGV